MTPLEKALSEKGKVNYCDECELFQIVGNAVYCKVDGKLILPIMLARSQGTGPAWNCKKRNKTSTHYDRIRAKTVEELAEFICGIYTLKEDMYGDYDYRLVVDGNEFRDDEGLLDWLKSPVEKEVDE